MKTTDVGYINKNNQKNLGYRGVSETHYNQKFFEMECLDCGHRYMANGCDVWLRKCPHCGENKPKVQSRRTISDKLRYQVLKRDNFKCCACGASPAKDPNIELHIDHILPWSKGGETKPDNLQTLCSRCNLGKSNDSTEMR
ncbi:MAG: HNH endonuclease [Lachnospiraceae bacterium]|nr:HNH endonuclease [Lachnospiraceae bacterium]